MGHRRHAGRHPGGGAVPEPGGRLSGADVQSLRPDAADGLDLVFLRPAPRRSRRSSCPTCASGSPRSSTWPPTSGCATRPLYPAWYGEAHTAPELLGRVRVRPARAVPGRASWPATAVAAAGCYPTAAALALAPLVRGRRDRADGVVVDAASGVSGAGRSLKHDDALRHRQRGLHRLRVARPPPHAGDRAGQPDARCSSRRTSRR